MSFINPKRTLESDFQTPLRTYVLILVYNNIIVYIVIDSKYFKCKYSSFYSRSVSESFTKK